MEGESFLDIFRHIFRSCLASNDTSSSTLHAKQREKYWALETLNELPLRKRQEDEDDKDKDILAKVLDRPADKYVEDYGVRQTHVS